MSITKNKVINMWLIGTFMAFVAMCAVTLVFLVIETLNLDKQNDAIKAIPTNTDTWNDSGNYSTTAPQGSGTEADPYLISTAKELAWISVNYAGTANGKYFLQTANIDLGAHYWVPINNSSAAHAYQIMLAEWLGIMWEQSEIHITKER